MPRGKLVTMQPPATPPAGRPREAGDPASAWDRWLLATAEANARRLEEETELATLFATAMKSTAGSLGEGLRAARALDNRYLLTVPQVAELLACSETHVRTLLRSGDLPAVRPAGVLRVRPADLDVYLRERSTGGGSAYANQGHDREAAEPAPPGRSRPRSRA